MFVNEIEEILREISHLEQNEIIDKINQIKILLHKYSPFKNEPVDCVLWVKSSDLIANDYNPNKVAPPEMKLLERSIQEDGYTQPIVAWRAGNNYEVVDGFHRNRVGKESPEIKKRIFGYLPVSIIKESRQDRGNRIAATIRHNRARGKHTVEGMSDIVLELKNRNWSNERIAKQLGMEPDEILRLCQITGLASLFSDQDFSKSWDIENYDVDFEMLNDNISEYGDETSDFRTVNTSDEDRIFHTYDKWECYKAGFYDTTKEGMTKQECEQEYYNVLSDAKRFANILEKIIVEWKHSCEHYLTNKSMNRIAWLGQAAVCYDTGIPAEFRSGFYLLSEKQQKEANEVALAYLNKWLEINNREKVGMDEALSGKEMDLY